MHTTIEAAPSADTLYTADDLAHTLAEEGFAKHEQTVLWIAEAAARAGVSPTLLAALLDQSAPQVTRQRAFSAVVAAMSSGRVLAA